jgi:probable rRNA maturation factor
MTPAPRAKLKIDVLVESALWHKPANVRSIVRRAVAQAAAAQSTIETELAIVLTDDSAVRQLNHLWRGIDAATNVLSFPSPAPVKQGADAPPHLGDIVLAYETIAREARAEGKPLGHHVAHLAVHGYLHLLGYDHLRGKDAEAMEAAERRILRRLAIPDPYRRPRAKKPAPKRGKKSRTLPRIPA